MKFFVSNAPQSTPLEILLHVAFNRWHVERCFQDEKDQLGLSHFEVRNYPSLRRHWTITAVSHLFLAKIQLQWRGKNPELTVCQLRHATSALVQARLLQGMSKRRLLEHAARVIQLRQHRNAKARRSHQQTRHKELGEMGIDLSNIRCCIQDE